MQGGVKPQLVSQHDLWSPTLFQEARQPYRGPEAFHLPLHPDESGGIEQAFHGVYDLIPSVPLLETHCPMDGDRVSGEVIFWRVMFLAAAGKYLRFIRRLS